MSVGDMAAEFAEVHEDDRAAFIAGVTLAYRDVFTAIGAAFTDETGLIGAHVAVVKQYDNVTAMIAVEGVI